MKGAFVRQILQIVPLSHSLTDNKVGGEKINMEPKDWITLVSILVTLVIGITTLIISIRTNKKSRFVNAVTTERVKWMTNLKELISEYLSLATYYDDKPFLSGEEQAKYFERLFYLQNNIKLQLNYTDSKDQEINELIDKINQKIIGLYKVKKIIEKKDTVPKEELEKAMEAVLKEKEKEKEFAKKIKSDDYSFQNFLEEIYSESRTVIGDTYRKQYGYAGRDELMNLTDSLVNKCRKYLKYEWEKVKKEAKNGSVK